MRDPAFSKLFNPDDLKTIRVPTPDIGPIVRGEKTSVLLVYEGNEGFKKGEFVVVTGGLSALTFSTIVQVTADSELFIDEDRAWMLVKFR